MAALAAVGFALYMLNGLVLSSPEGVAWQLVVAAGFALGLIVTWIAISFRLPTWSAVLANVVIATVTAVRVAAPETTVSLLPTARSLRALGDHLSWALNLIRNGIEPVAPYEGIVVIGMLVFWALGVLVAWGLTKGHPYVALLPPLILSLQLATMALNGSASWLIAVFIAIVAGTIYAITTDERDHSAGRMAPESGGSPPRRSRFSPTAVGLVVLTVATSLVISGGLSNAVPADGLIDWRGGSDVAGGIGTAPDKTYNAFISIRQRLVHPTADPVFTARLDGDLPHDEIYFQLLTMESYDGEAFFASNPIVAPLEDQVWEDTDLAFGGASDQIHAEVEIEGLRSQWLPVVYTPVALRMGNPADDHYMRVRPLDGSVAYRGGQTDQGMTYEVTSRVPRPDINVLVHNPATGTRSAAFASATGVTHVTAAELRALHRPTPPDAIRYLSLPQDRESRMDEIAAMAALRTAHLGTDFEKGLALEAWLRSMTYTTDIQPGHGATDLAAWLLDPDSPNYQQGYCENFSTAMAVMARTLDIPSRVVLGFTPGDPHPSQEGVVIVRDRNAHAWVELWMPTQGWVRFDPTPRGDQVNPSTVANVEHVTGLAVTDHLVRDIETGLEPGGDVTSTPPTTTPVTTTTQADRTVPPVWAPPAKWVACRCGRRSLPLSCSWLRWFWRWCLGLCRSSSGSSDAAA